MPAQVQAVASHGAHRFSKTPMAFITLVAGLGVAGDAHAGATVQHRSRVRVDPAQPNLRQVHLIHRELFDELRTKGFEIAPGQIGENITTSGIDLLALPQAAVLRIGRDAVVEITGLRNPCVQLNTFRPGLMQACLGRDADGALLLKAGVMGVIRQGGMVMAGDAITVELPALPHRKLERV